VAPKAGFAIGSLSPQGRHEGVVFFFDNYVTINSNYSSDKIDLPKIPVLKLLFANHAFNNASPR
jgi:hypothetical protein